MEEKTKKEKVCIDLDAKELKEFAKYAGLTSSNTGVFILRAFLSTFLMSLPKNKFEGKTSHFKFNNTTTYEN